MSQSSRALEPTRDLHVFAHFIDRARALSPLRVAICHPASPVALEGAIDAAKAGLIEPIFVGPIERLTALAQQNGLDLSPYQRVDARDEETSAEAAVALCRSGNAQALMKGSLHTDILMHAVMARDSGIRGSGRISHCFVMDTKAYSRTLLISDAAINIAPSLDDKAAITQNAIDLARALGIENPAVAILSAVETVNPKMSSTLDAAALCKMADRGQIVGGILDGPLAFDTAISLEAAAIKGLRSPVAGHADILIVPDLESGNMLAKQLEYLGGAKAAGIVLGASVPIILTSRADHRDVRLASCALACLLAAAQTAARQARD